VSRYSHHAAWAVELARFTTTLEAQRLFCASSGFAPAVEAAYTDPVLLAADPFLARIRVLHDYAVLRPLVPRYALASDILQRHLSAALSGAVPADRAMREAARETRLLIASAAPPGRETQAP
jgi:multiple sugar transport system substrate-binding protein